MIQSRDFEMRCLDLNPSSTTCQLCEIGQVLNLLVHGYLIWEMACPLVVVKINELVHVKQLE